MLHRVALSRVRLFPVMMLMTMLIHQGYAFEYEDPYADKPKKQDKPPSISYVTPIEDTYIPTPAPEKAVWVQPMQSYSCIGKANIGWLIIYTDSQGIKRIGLVPWRDRMNNVTADEEGNIVRIRAGTVVPMGQGGLLLKANTPYPIVENHNEQLKVQYSVGSYSNTVTVARSKMQFVEYVKAQRILKELAIQDEAASQYRPEKINVTQSTGSEKVDGLTVIERVRNYKSPSELRKYWEGSSPPIRGAGEYNSILRMPDDK
jgi:hypothetical protein